MGCEETFFWTGDLLTINALDNAVKVDILFTCPLEIVQLPPLPLMDGVCFKLVNMYNMQRPLRSTTSLFRYDPVRTAVFQSFYAVVGNHVEWRSLLLLLKSIDSNIPTCMLAVVLSLSAWSRLYFAPEADPWRFGLEVVNRFLRTFVPESFADADLDAPGACESFLDTVWTPFCNFFLGELVEDPRNPMESLFTTSQMDSIRGSHLSMVCSMAYPAKTFSTPVLSMPRPVAPFVVHRAVEFIIAGTSFSELELRQLGTVPFGIRHLAMQFVAEWGDDEFTEWMMDGLCVEASPMVVESVSAIAEGY